MLGVTGRLLKTIVADMSASAHRVDVMPQKLIIADAETASTIEGIENLGYTVKYKYYRSLKKSSGYKAMLMKSDKTYLNTYGVKNAMYYYKVRVMIYDNFG